MSTREVDKFEQTLIINQNYKLFQSGMLLLAQGRNLATSNFTMMMMVVVVMTMMVMMMMMLMVMVVVVMTMIVMMIMTTWVQQ